MSRVSMRPCGIKDIAEKSKRFTARARKFGHTLHIAGQGGNYKTYQCNKCGMVGTITPYEMYGPLITQKCPGRLKLHRLR